MDKFLRIDENTYQLSRDGENLSYIQVFELLTAGDSLTEIMTNFLVEWNQDFFWEHPKVSNDTCKSNYEVSVIPTDAFNNREENFDPFKSKFKITDQIKVFHNLRKDSLLIVPNKNEVSDQNFVTLRKFLQTAPKSLIKKFWKTVGETMIDQISKNSDYCYLSTHGLGVLWLHVRVDQRPKYYHTKKYRVSR